MSAIVFEVQIIPDKFQVFEINQDAVLQKVLPDLLRSVSGKKDGLNLKDYRVLIAHQLTEPEVVAKALDDVDAATPVATEHLTVKDLKVKTGFYLIFVEQPTNSARLQLLVHDELVAVLDGPDRILLGRTDEASGILPDVDLTPHLGQNELKVSREQAVLFFDQDDRWKVRLHENARTTVFLNEERLEKNRNYEIPDEALLNFGNDPYNPVLRMLARIVVN